MNERTQLKGEEDSHGANDDAVLSGNSHVLCFGGTSELGGHPCNVFPLISGGKVALNRLRPFPRFNATFPPILRGKGYDVRTEGGRGKK